MTSSGQWDALAESVSLAKREGRLLAADDFASPTSVEDVYIVQSAVGHRRFSLGAKQIGWKLGYTSEAMRRQMGVDQPNRGPLFAPMMLESGSSIAAGVVQPRIEPEIGIRLSRAVTPDMAYEDVHDSIESAHACLEVVDSVWLGYQFDWSRNTLDLSSAAFVVIGPVLPVDVSLSQVDVTLSIDGILVGSGSGADALGDPVEALRWLAADLVGDQRGLIAGDFVITGGLTQAFPMIPGAVVSAEFRSMSGAVAQVVSVNRSES